VGGEVVQDDVDRGAVRTRGTDRPEHGQGVVGAHLAAVDAPEGVVADRVAAVEVPDSVGAVGRSRDVIRGDRPEPSRSTGRTDAERPELVERERTVREAIQDVLDAVELGVAVGVR